MGRVGGVAVKSRNCGRRLQNQSAESFIFSNRVGETRSVLAFNKVEGD